jgi:hypothetical protein
MAFRRETTEESLEKRQESRSPGSPEYEVEILIN